MYIRGHNLYSLIAEIGEDLWNRLKKKEKLEAAGQHTGAVAVYAGAKTFKKELEKTSLLYTYPEINKISTDVKTIWS